MAGDNSDLLAPPPEPLQSSAVATLPAATSGDDNSDLLTAPPPEQPSKTGLSQEPMPGWQKGFAAITDRLTVGGAAVNKAGAGLILAAGGSMEDAQKNVESMALAEANQDREDFINTHAYWNLFKLRDLPWADKDETGVVNAADIPGTIIEQIPQLGIVGGGMAYGAIGGSVFGPAGVAIGAGVGGTLAAGTMIFGSHVYDSMSRGVPRTHALVGGAISGAIGGVATQLGLGAIGKMLPGAAEVVFQSQGFRQAVTGVAGTLLRGVGLDVAAMDVQSAVDAGIKYAETRVAKVEKPVTLKEVLGDIAASTAQALVVAPVFGGVSTGVGVHAGIRAKAAHAEVQAAIADFTYRMAKLQAVHSQFEAEAAAKREAETAERATVEKVKARKQLKGFVEVDQTLPVETANDNYLQAKAAHEAAPDHEKPITKLALVQAEAELKQAKYGAQIQAIEEALTEPDLLGTIKAKREQLEAQIETLQQFRKGALTQAERDALDVSIAKAKESRRLVADLEALGSPDKVRQHIEQMKARIEQHAQQTQLDVAHAALKHRMATREKAIEHLRAGIREHKAAAKIDFTEHRTGNSAPEYGDIPAKTAHKRERLEQLREQQEMDKVILAMLEDGDLGAGDVTDLSPKVPEKRLHGLVELAKKKVDQAAKLGAREQAKLLKSAKRLLDSVIDLSRLPKGDKTALKARYSSVDLVRLQEILPELQGKIEELFGKRRLEAARADLKAQLDKINIDARSASTTPGTEELLGAIKQFATGDDAVHRFLESIQDKDSLTPIEEAKAELTDLFPAPVKEMTAQQIERIIDSIVELRETGKTEALRRYQERQARAAHVKKTVLERMAPSAQGKQRLQKGGIRGVVEKILDDKIQSEISTFRGLMTIITQFGDVDDLSDILDVKSALSDMHKLRIGWEKRWQEMLAEEGMDAKRWQRFNIKANKRGEKLTYLHVEQLDDGSQIESVQTLEHPNGKALTLWEMVQVRNYLLDEDPDAVSRLRNGNGFSYPNQVVPHHSTLEVVEEYLDEKLGGDWRTVADTMRSFYKEFAGVVDETVYRRYGRHIPENGTYGGQLLTAGDGSGRFNEAFRRMTTRPGSTKARQGGSARVEIRSAMDNLKDHIAQYAREHALNGLEQDVRVFHDQEVTDRIRRTIGDNTVKVIHKYIEDIILGQQRSYTTVDRVLGWLREAIYSRFLGARPEQFAKQITGFVHGLQFVGPEAMLDGYAYLLANPEEAHELMNESGLFQARKLVRDPDYKPEATSTLRRFNSSLMKSVEVGDHYAIYGAAFPVLLDALRKTGDKQKALKAFETAFDTTQSSGAVDELPSVFRGNAALRLFTIMAQEPTRQVEAISTAFRKYRSGKVAFGHVLRIVGVTYAGALLYNLMGYIVMYPFLTDEQKEEKLTYLLDISPLGPYAGVAVLGQLLSSMTVSSMKLAFNQKTKAYEPEILATDITLDAFRFFEKMQKLGSEGGDAADYWSALLLAGNLLGDVTGVPATNILTKTEPFTGVKD